MFSLNQKLNSAQVDYLSLKMRSEEGILSLKQQVQVMQKVRSQIVLRSRKTVIIVISSLETMAAGCREEEGLGNPVLDMVRSRVTPMQMSIACLT